MANSNKKKFILKIQKVVRLKVEKFGDDYFYQLGLNLKFCEGIERFRQTSEPERFGVGIKKIIFDWSRTKCSQDGYVELVEALETLTKENNDVMREFFNIWPGIESSEKKIITKNFSM